MEGYFITGTDTEVGKTYVSAMLLRQLVQQTGGNTRITGFKPFCSGPRDDAEALRNASSPPPPLDIVNPCWFALPAAPLVAARQEAFPLQVQSLWTAWEQLSSSYEIILAEGAGGWLTPLLPGMRVADLARRLGLPVLVVASNRLGAINHTLLTVERIQADGLDCAGVFLNNLPQPDERQLDEETPARTTNAGVIMELLPDGVPLLASIPPHATELPAQALERFRR